MGLDEFADIGPRNDALHLIEKNRSTRGLGVFVESVSSMRGLIVSSMRGLINRDKLD